MAQLFSSSRLDKAWRPLSASWFSLLIVGGIIAAIIFVDQIQELLIDAARPLWAREFWFLSTAVLAAALCAWYFTRALLYVDYPADDDELQDPSDKWISRLLILLIVLPVAGLFVWPGLAVFWLIFLFGALVVFIGVAVTRASKSPLKALRTQNGRKLDSAEIWLPRIFGLAIIVPVGHLYFARGMLGPGLVNFVIAGVFLIFVVTRQDIKFSELITLRKIFLGPTARCKTQSMPRVTWIVLLVILGASLALTIAFLIWRSSLAQYLGTGAIMYLAAGSWIAFANLALIHPARRYDMFSFFLILPVIAFGVGQISEQHYIRKCDASVKGCEISPAKWEKNQIGVQLQKWVDRRQLAIAEAIQSGRKYPIIVISAEGGGVRAAYWTATALSRIQDMYPAFYCHIFAISAVSGGSLGAAVFTGLIADELSADADDACRETAVEHEIGPIAEKAKNATNEDFLAPIAAGILFSDVLQSFLPISLPDRAVFLEESWERAWSGATGTETMRGPFRSLWADGREFIVPSLFLNATRVSTGQRIAASNIALADSITSAFVELTDVSSLLGQSISLSTATHLSARFAYLSPTGLIRTKDGTREEYLVDGGYFEDVGALTAAEIMQRILAYIDAQDEHRALIPTVIAIINTEPKKRKDWVFDDNTLGRELFAPPKALLEARTARGRHADARLRKIMRERHNPVIDVSLVANNNNAQMQNVPFAWSLSDRSENLMDTAIENFLCTSLRNKSVDATRIQDFLNRGDDNATGERDNPCGRTPTH